MVTKNRTLVIIAVLDLAYIFITVASYIFSTFQYMNHFAVSIFKITYEFHENELLARVPAFYLLFDDYFCDIRSNMEFKEICDRYASFYNAAIIYLSLTLLNMFLILYNFLHFTALTLEWRPRWYLSLGCSHYLYPIIHSIAALAYLWTTNFYGLKPPKGFNSDFDIAAGGGLFLMFFSQVVSVIGLFIYLFSRNEATGNESFVEETSEDGYKRIEDGVHKKNLPVLPVSEDFEEESEEKGGKTKKKSLKNESVEWSYKSEEDKNSESNSSDSDSSESDSS